MKTLIKKADGSPAKSRIYAATFLKKNGLSSDNLIEENGCFYYEAEEQIVKPEDEKEPVVKTSALTWETNVFQEKDVYTKLAFKNNINLEVTLKAKHPNGQSAQRPYNAVEVKIADSSFVMNIDLAKEIFEVKGV